MAEDSKKMSIDQTQTLNFIESLDRMAREKPAGYFAYMATCQSAMQVQNITAIDPDKSEI